jgi:hypothetical protein
MRRNRPLRGDCAMEEPFEIRADGVDVAAVMEEIRRTVEAKKAAGAYDDPRIARAERLNVDRLKDEDAFVDFYLESLHHIFLVDINDFPIRTHRGILGAPIVLLKKTIWKLLKFYTYRLFTQQNQINGQMVGAVDGLNRKVNRRLERIEERLERIEAEGRTPPSDG